MTNLLIMRPSDSITVGGVTLKIKTDFSLWVRFITANRRGDADGVISSLKEILGGIPRPEYLGDIYAEISKWLGCGGEKSENSEKSSNSVFDFCEDGNVIYCELWEYFPFLMERGISFHEGIELIKILMMNDSTVIWHRAFARGGDFSNLSKEQKAYWQKERAKYALKDNDGDIDLVFSGAFK